MAVCNEDCFNCPYKDCVKEFNGYTLNPDKFKKYEKTDKAKARSKKYRQSDKGKQNEKKKQMKKVESGKNAEYCRRYYQEHKEEILRRKQEARERAKQQLEKCG